jgi:hypothetical protein
MKVIESKDVCLDLEGDAVEGAREAFRELRYVEAFALLNMAIDEFMICIWQSRRIALGV